jgi:hypothetical protein
MTSFWMKHKLDAGKKFGDADQISTYGVRQKIKSLNVKISAPFTCNDSEVGSCQNNDCDL